MTAHKPPTKESLAMAREWLRHAHSEEDCKMVKPQGYFNARCHFISDDGEGDELCLAALIEQAKDETIEKCAAVSDAWAQKAGYCGGPSAAIRALKVTP